MSWTQDYCTVCDKQCSSGSMYCSRECLATESSEHRSSESSVSAANLLGATSRRLSEAASEPSRLPKQDAKTTPAISPSALLVRQDEKFLYDSPVLKPQQNNALSVSPPLSPLLIAQGSGDATLGASVGRLSQSSSSYRRWLQNEN